MRANELPARRGIRTAVALQIPSALVLERYRLLRRLGAGAFATVWEACDERLQRSVALKIMAPERVSGGRFEREARAAARLAHPGIVTLYEAAIDADGAYLVTELVRGHTFGALLGTGRLCDRDVVELALALCDALDHAHAKGVFHRDVKPSNILVPAAPVTPAHIAKLTDFGVARVVGGDTLTRTGDVMGTLAYMSPEQAEGLPVGAPADLYSLALVVYEALSGVNPVGTGTAAQRSRRLGAHLPPLRRYRRDLPRELGQGLDLALRPRARERGSIAELRSALAVALPHLDDRVAARGGSAHSRVPHVSGPWSSPDRFGKKATRERDGAAPTEAQAAGRAQPELPEPRREEEEQGTRRLSLSLIPPPAPGQGLAARALAAGAAAALGAWLCADVIQPRPVPAGLVALVAGLLVGLAPRLGWLLLVVASATLLAITGLTGDALLLLPAGLLPVLLLPNRGTAWPAPAGALLLGVAGLAGAWPALAAAAGTAWRRAALAITGWAWLIVAGELSGKSLYVRALPGTPSQAAWSSSAYDTVHYVIAGPATTRLVLAAAVWGAAAAILPALRSRRSVLVDALLALIWAAALAGVVPIVLGPVSGGAGLISAHRLMLGMLAGALVAVAQRAASGWRIARRPDPSSVA